MRGCAVEVCRGIVDPGAPASSRFCPDCWRVVFREAREAIATSWGFGPVAFAGAVEKVADYVAEVRFGPGSRGPAREVANCRCVPIPEPRRRREEE